MAFCTMSASWSNKDHFISNIWNSHAAADYKKKYIFSAINKTPQNERSPRSSEAAKPATSLQHL
jgi:hypothetical protein